MFQVVDSRAVSFIPFRPQRRKRIKDQRKLPAELLVFVFTLRYFRISFLIWVRTIQMLNTCLIAYRSVPQLGKWEQPFSVKLD